MRTVWCLIAAAISGLALTSTDTLAATVDGTLDGSYGAPGSVQTNFTGFGDNNDASVGLANGSELDAGYGTISGGRLYLFFAGNLETNFNKLDIFIDSGIAGGQNALGSLTGNQGNFNNMSGLTFDTGFDATHWISVTAGNPTPDIYVDYGNLTTDSGFYAGQTVPGVGTLSGGSGPVIEATLNNSNITGVTGATAPNDAATVSTGVEVSIALSDIGYVGGPLLISAFINNGDHNYASNQFLGGLPSGTGNLGGDGGGSFTGTLSGINLNQFAGGQYFRVVPEPTTLGVIAGAAVLGLRRRK